MSLSTFVKFLAAGSKFFTDPEVLAMDVMAAGLADRGDPCVIMDVGVNSRGKNTGTTISVVRVGKPYTEMSL